MNNSQPFHPAPERHPACGYLCRIQQSEPCNPFGRRHISFFSVYIQVFGKLSDKHEIDIEGNPGPYCGKNIKSICFCGSVAKNKKIPCVTG
jgi:hypothetical protein